MMLVQSKMPCGSKPGSVVLVGGRHLLAGSHTLHYPAVPLFVPLAAVPGCALPNAPQSQALGVRQLRSPATPTPAPPIFAEHAPTSPSSPVPVHGRDRLPGPCLALARPPLRRPALRLMRHCTAAAAAGGCGLGEASHAAEQHQQRRRAGPGSEAVQHAGRRCYGQRGGPADHPTVSRRPAVRTRELGAKGGRGRGRVGGGGGASQRRVECVTCYAAGGRDIEHSVAPLNRRRPSVAGLHPTLLNWRACTRPCQFLPVSIYIYIYTVGLDTRGRRRGYAAARRTGDGRAQSSG